LYKKNLKKYEKSLDNKKKDIICKVSTLCAEKKKSEEISMKKIILVLALILLIALPIFAQEVTVEDLQQQIKKLSMVSFTGAIYFVPDFYYDASGFYFYSYRYRFRLNFNYKDDIYGVFARLQWTDSGTYQDFEGTTSSGVDIIKFAYGKVGLFNNLIVLTAGIGVPYGYTPFNNVLVNLVYVDPNFVGAKDNIIFAGIDGMKIDFNFSGLNIGIMLPINYNDTTLATDQVKGLAIGAKYSIENIGTIYLVAENLLDSANLNYAAAFELTAVENLSFAAKFSSAAGTMGFGVTAGYYIGSIFIADDFAYDLTNKVIINDAMVMYIADVWDAYLTFTYITASDLVFSLNFDYYVGKFTLNPILTITLSNPIAIDFSTYMTFAF